MSEMKYDILPKDIVGMIFKNNANQKYQVLEVSGKKKNNTKMYRVRFLETGYERVLEKVEIKRGKVKDKYEKSILGIACMGDIKMVNHKREYNIWYKMLERCYVESNIYYSSYGGKGVYVDERWHNFENFIKDIPNIDGYDETLFKENKLQLDKDIKQFNLIENKIYSKDTCTFVSQEINNTYRDNDHRKFLFYGLSPNNEVIEIFGLKNFIKDNPQFNRTSISKILKGDYGLNHTYKGWKFSYAKEDLAS